MRRARAPWLVAWLAQAACAGPAPASPVANSAGPGRAQTDPILLVSLCSIVRTRDGADVDDAGVAVELIEDGSRPARRIGRIVGGCREVGLLAHREVARAECRTPHVDATDVVRVMRLDASTVVVEVFAIDDDSRRETPIARQRVSVDRTTRVHLTLDGACTLEPEPGK